MHWLFPKHKAKYITILRDPLKQFESVFNFMHFATPLGFGGEKDPLGTFLKYPPSFKDTHPLMKKTLALHLLRNPMLFDLGLDFRYFQNQSAIENYIDYTDNEFNLVMILEHFDESLILLKQLMCWSFEDILYFKLNERQDKHKRDALEQTVKDNIRSWNYADNLLYQYFNQTLWRKIKAQGKAFVRELEIFRRINARTSMKCLQDGSFLDEAYTGVYVKGYSLRTDLPQTLKTRCENMKKNEISYVKYFRKKMSEKIMALEEPDEYLDDPLNDWDMAADYEHGLELTCTNHHTTTIIIITTTTTIVIIIITTTTTIIIIPTTTTIVIIIITTTTTITATIIITTTPPPPSLPPPSSSPPPNHHHHCLHHHHHHPTTTTITATIIITTTPPPPPPSPPPPLTANITATITATIIINTANVQLG
ncbi:hypothetical protein QZH41_005325 [Actinostola sp. cb2023]|nr:hypothetical protein QZH41_005325 [Actinostola sp. cb2023]